MHVDCIQIGHGCVQINAVLKVENDFSYADEDIIEAFLAGPIRKYLLSNKIAVPESQLDALKTLVKEGILEEDAIHLLISLSIYVYIHSA